MIDRKPDQGVRKVIHLKISSLLILGKKKGCPDVWQGTPKE
jgi:hypothetical protein